MGGSGCGDLETRVAELERRLVRRRGERSVPALAAALVLVALSVPLAVAGESRDDRPVAAAGNERGEAVQIGVRNRSDRETGLIASGGGYSLRLSNVNRGDGGGAIFGCRAGAGADESCVNADNLTDGRAFWFRSREGSSAGHFQVDGPGAVPFTTNARGMVQNLNAEMVGGMTAQQLLARTPQQTTPGPQGPQGPPGPQGPQGPQGEQGPPGPGLVDSGYAEFTEPDTPIFDVGGVRIIATCFPGASAVDFGNLSGSEARIYEQGSDAVHRVGHGGSVNLGLAGDGERVDFVVQAAWGENFSKVTTFIVSLSRPSDGCPAEAWATAITNP